MNEMHLMHKAQEKMVNECTKIAKNATFLVSDIDLVVDGKQYVFTHSHGPVYGKIEVLPFGTKVGPKGGAEKLKDMAEEADVDMTLKV